MFNTSTIRNHIDGGRDENGPIGHIGPYGRIVALCPEKTLQKTMDSEPSFFSKQDPDPI